VAVLLGALSLGTAGRARFGELIIESPGLAAWIPINNSFNREPTATDWDGVLIQIGDYLDAVGDTEIRAFESITFENSTGGVLLKLGRGDFNWINIVVEDPSRGDPMLPEHAELLYPAAGTASGCEAVDLCTAQQCLCDRGHCPPPDPEMLFAPFLRLRSLHGFFRPFAIITYWFGPRGYDLAALPRAGGPTRHLITFNDPVKVFRDGQLLNLGRIDTIRLNLCGDCEHGNHIDPPWR